MQFIKFASGLESELPAELNWTDSKLESNQKNILLHIYVALKTH